MIRDKFQTVFVEHFGLLWERTCFNSEGATRDREDILPSWRCRAVQRSRSDIKQGLSHKVIFSPSLIRGKNPVENKL